MDITSTEKLLSTDYMHAFASRFRNRRHVSDWFFVSRQTEPNSIRPNCVMVVPFLYKEHEDRKTSVSTVVIKEFRVPIRDWIISFPAGCMEADEDIVEAAGRELKEETGLEVDYILDESPVLFNSPGLTDEAVKVVFVAAKGTISDAHTTDHEEIIPMELDHKQIEEMVNQSNLKIESKAWLILRVLATNGMYEHGLF